MNTRPTLLIADDEEAPREQLLDALAQVWPQANVVAVAHHGADAWDQWLEHEPEVCFLDIHMPGLSGIEVAQRIAGRSAVVFVTAYGDHALAAFDAGAVDYVLKPVEEARLAQAVRRVQTRLRPVSEAPPAAGESAAPAPSPEALQALLAKLARDLQRPAKPEVLQASVGKEVRMIRLRDVLFFESDTRYTRVVYRADGEDAEALIRTPLKDLLAQLDEQLFTQIHRSVIVRSEAIASAVRDDAGNMHLRLRGRDERLPVSRQFQGLFKGQ
ncbi:LytR/AlgR family response regulator transcription factor [Inhella gelatinilytica]|uniref:Response regulator transcription factor n=1 Tax=Inhella gelatinilytica TaxID=2795030 RepID=A0A931ITW2_9BURK|nr:LytTR family DNA-binding domain-containing protein [Inhella gelatinilytica]MBH9551441.1 response regulator transcription factor [Inhella gelatinilytica]